MRLRYKHIVLIIPALIIYALIAHHLRFIQDDAYISYRYVANFLNGNGLVYNIGERVEGFTNFGWVIYLILWGAVGANYILASQITGFLFGAGIIVLTYIIARRIFTGKAWPFALLPTYLVAFNQSLGYWSPAGLETAAFAFFALLSLYFFLTRSRLLVLSLALGVWVRPEGALVAILLLAIEAITERRFPKFTLIAAGWAFALSLPMVAFKLVYYRSLLPNPFYAKTGLSIAHLKSGIEYAGRFLAHYGFYGIGFMAPIVFIRKLSREALTVWLFAVLYTLYIVLVGGDVLKVHRFFLPVFGPAAILIALTLWHLVQRLNIKTAYLTLSLAAVPLLALTWYLPSSFVARYNQYEKNFTFRMAHQARAMKASDSRNFSVALPTIGIFGYELLGHDIIDMLGLTDSTIARHSEEPIPGMQSTWKETKHNSRYLLERGPDYITFSTGIKPSAPAEKALMLYDQFLESYRVVPWLYRPGVINSAFKKVHPITGEIVPTHSVAYVDYYKHALELRLKRKDKEALTYFDSAVVACGQPYNLEMLSEMAATYGNLSRHQEAMALMDGILSQDSTLFACQRNLYRYAMLLGDSAKAEIHREWLKKNVPWYWPRVDTLVNQALARRDQSLSKR